MPRAFVCVDCGQEGEHHRPNGVPPKRCPPCKAEHRNALGRESYARTSQLTPRGSVCVCVICGESFTAQTKRAQLCSKDCRKQYRTTAAMSRREANAEKGVVCHCGKGVQAKGLCLYHYSQSRREAVGRQEKPKVTACTACGVDVVKKQTRSARRPVCSTWCRHFVSYGRWPASAWPTPVRQPRTPASSLARRVLAQQKADRAADGSRGSTWYSGWCRVCKTWFTTLQPQGVTCSRQCARRAARDRRRARKRNAFVASVSPQYIYERDKWKCQLCGKKVKRNAVVPHPLAPTIDHMIPLGGKNDGTHEPANCHTAHFICNARKGDRGGGEQLALIG